MKRIKLIDELVSMANDLELRNEIQLDALKRRAEMIIRIIFDDKTKYLKDLKDISFHPMYAPSTEQEKINTWQRAKSRIMNLFSTIKEELMIFNDIKNTETQKDDNLSNDKIFIVHGKDEEMKQTTARVIEKLNLEPIILHEKPNEGKTIIEKFTDYSKVGFAIVLLSPDDIVLNNGDDINSRTYRARQNVIFELGYFIGKIGRNRVIALYKDSENFEMPSDYSGVLFVPYDMSGKWKFDICKELKSCGYEIDANLIIWIL